MRFFIAISIIAFLLFFMVAALFWYFSYPLRPLPKPTGPYGIGRMRYYIADEQRSVPHPQAKTPRAWNFSLWYPTDEEQCRCYPYIDRRIVAKMLQELGAKLLWILKPLYWVYLRVLNPSVACFSEPEAPLSRVYKQYPVIFFSPGYGALPELYAAVLENLASHGFVVVGMNHPGMNGPTVLPQGDLIATRIELETDQDWQREIDAAVVDIQKTYEFLEHENQNSRSIWYQKLNLVCMGAFGHSFGSMVPVTLCKQDQRFCAGINLDGWLGDRTRNTQEPLTKPFLFVVNDADWPTPKSRNENMRDMQAVCALLPDACSVKVLSGSNHFTFCDISLLKVPFNCTTQPQTNSNTLRAMLCETQSQKNPYDVLAILNGMIVEFFAKTIQ